MKRNKRNFGFLLSNLVFALCVGSLFQPNAANVPEGLEAVTAAGQAREVDLVICLDTSSSMSGLIDAARQKLWSIVNLLAQADPTPRLRVALLTFGHDSYDAESGWVKVDSGLTSDLDLISERLFALSTSGGTEYVGRVVRTALDRLDWDPAEDTLKLIVVAGNESAEQDPQVATRDVASDAIRNGIMINTIFCGPPADSVASGWQSVARLADGHFSAIDQDHGTVIVSSPFDDELASLSAAINETYIPIGDAGRRGLANQQAQDSNAAGMNSAAAASRAATKSGALYVSHWDLVDAMKSKSVDWDKLEADDLPEAMRSMNREEQQEYVAEKQRQRGEMQAKIRDLEDQRQAHIAEVKKLNAVDESASFERALGEAIRSQATSKGFRFVPTEPAGAAAEELQ